MRKCIEHLLVEEEHSSGEELSLPPPSSLSVRGSSSMSYLADLTQVYDKHCISENNDIFIIYLHFLNTHVQVLAPRGGTFSYGLHEPLWAMNNGDVGHSLGDLREMMYSPWCDSLTPTIIHLLQACKKDGAANKCWGKHLLYHILWKLGVKLHWFHLRDHCPSPLLHMEASMTLIMIPYAEDVLTFVRNVVGGETHFLDVFLGEESPYFFCTTCSKGSMRNYMATITYHLFLYNMDHMFGWSTWSMLLMSHWEEPFYELPS